MEASPAMKASIDIDSEDEIHLDFQIQSRCEFADLPQFERGIDLQREMSD
jgi:hypothetical protein